MQIDSTASEKAIEDILAQSPHILAPLLDIDPAALVPVARQQFLPGGRTDLVYLAGNAVILIELKVEKATVNHVAQLAGYVDTYSDDATKPAFATDRELRPVLLAPEIPSDIRDECKDEGFDPIEYDLEAVLDEYQETLFADLAQFQVEGAVTSVARLGLMNEFLAYLAESSQPVTVDAVAQQYGTIGKGQSESPESRVRNFRKTATGLDLVHTVGAGMVLTERGERYVESGDREQQPWQVTVMQAERIVDLLYEDPFYSNLTYSLVALVDSVYELSKNTHPVPRNRLEDWYASKVGKAVDWNDRTRTDVVRWIGAFLEELGLVSVLEHQFYLTPEGFSLLSHVAIDEGKAMIRSQR